MTLRSISLLLLGLVASISCSSNGAEEAQLKAREASGEDRGLQRLLSSKATISHDPNSAPRWSEYHAPKPGTIVNVATEDDVRATVQYCLDKKIPFLAQNGGNGWADSIRLGRDGLLINLRGLNTTTVSADKTRATVSGGALIKEVIEAVYAADAQMLTGNCNCVGTLGAALGGGYGNLMGLYGFSVDNIVSLNVVLANGTATTVTQKSDPDLFWALRGAGPNFGIVTSAIMKARPVPKAQNTAWLGSLFYTQDKLERVVQAIQDLELQPQTNVFFYFVNADPAGYAPTIMVTPFYFNGTVADGRAAFKSLIDIGPSLDTTSVQPWTSWNTAGDAFCTKGSRKPTYSAGFNKMVPSVWRSVWNEYTNFLNSTPGAGNSAILVEHYSLKKAQSFPADSAAFSLRDVKYNGLAIAWYNDTAVDAKANAYGSKVRDLWRKSDNLPCTKTYVNFAHGDETNEIVYGDNTRRLRTLKKRYDPNGVFDRWFAL